jgi:predicted dehydrogenase
MPVRVGVVGCGYWGPNVVRAFAELLDAALVAVIDRSAEVLTPLRRRYPNVEYFGQDHRSLFELDVDAVAVCTPPETHYSIVRSCLEGGLDVLVEKPLATTARDAAELVRIAELNDRVLMVGHIGAYTPAVRALKDIVQSGTLGDIAYVDSVRGGLGNFHPALNVIWDLAPHDISILLYLLEDRPISVSVRAIACVERSIEDVAYTTFTFADGLLAHSRTSWVDPCKTRKVTVVGRQQMVVFDDLEPHEKLKIYDKRVDANRRTETFGEYQFAYHYGSVVSPFVQHGEPLRIECQHFIECVRNRSIPLTDGRNGLQVVQIIQAAQESLVCGGIDVPIRYETTPFVKRGRFPEPPADPTPVIVVDREDAPPAAEALRG